MLLAHRFRQLDPFQRIADLRQAIDPDVVVEIAQRRHDVLALPFRGQQVGIVHDVAQAQDQRHAAILQHPERVLDLAAQAQRLLVDDEDVGIEDVRGVMDDRAADLQRLIDVDMQVEGGVVAVAQLDDAGDAHEIDPGAEVEAADDRRARHDQDRELLVLLHQGMRDGAAAPQMPETEGVVAVDQYPGIPHAGFSAALRLSLISHFSRRDYAMGARRADREDSMASGPWDEPAGGQ